MQRYFKLWVAGRAKFLPAANLLISLLFIILLLWFILIYTEQSILSICLTRVNNHLLDNPFFVATYRIAVLWPYLWLLWRDQEAVKVEYNY